MIYLFLDPYENNKVLLDNENSTDMDGIQIIKLSNPEVTEVFFFIKVSFHLPKLNHNFFRTYFF